HVTAPAEWLAGPQVPEMVQQVPPAAHPREAEGLDGAIGTPAAVLGHAARRGGTSRIELIPDPDEKAAAGSGLDSACAGPFRDREPDAVGVIARVVDHQRAVAVGQHAELVQVGADRLARDGALLVEA